MGYQRQYPSENPLTRGTSDVHQDNVAPYLQEGLSLVLAAGEELHVLLCDSSRQGGVDPLLVSHWGGGGEDQGGGGGGPR